MKKSTLFAIAVAVLCLMGCGSKKDNAIQPAETIKETKEKDPFLCRYYDVLCLIGEDRWGSYDNYSNYLHDKINEQELEQELKQKGYGISSLIELQIAIDMGDYNFSKEYAEINDSYDEHLILNTSFCSWLFVRFKKAGVDVENYREFIKGFGDRECFDRYYEVAHNLNLVYNFGDFLSRLFECECECD